MTKLNKVLEYLKKNDITNKTETAKKLGVSRRTLDRALILSKATDKVKPSAKKTSTTTKNVEKTLSKSIKEKSVEIKTHTTNLKELKETEKKFKRSTSSRDIFEGLEIQKIARHFSRKFKKHIIQIEAFYACPLSMDLKWKTENLIEYLSNTFTNVTRKEILRAVVKAIKVGILKKDTNNCIHKGSYVEKVLKYQKEYKKIKQ